MALKALNSPLAGWVTTTFWGRKTLPPPTGMSVTWADSVPIAAPLPCAAGWPAIAGVLDAAGACWPEATPASSAPYGTAAVLQPASTPPIPAIPPPSSTPRRVARWSCWDSWLIDRPSLVGAGLDKTLLREPGHSLPGRRSFRKDPLIVDVTTTRGGGGGA